MYVQGSIENGDLSTSQVIKELVMRFKMISICKNVWNSDAPNYIFLTAVSQLQSSKLIQYSSPNNKAGFFSLLQKDKLEEG